MYILIYSIVGDFCRTWPTYTRTDQFSKVFRCTNVGNAVTDYSELNPNYR
jgi:hypothetical protein